MYIRILSNVTKRPYILLSRSWCTHMHTCVEDRVTECTRVRRVCTAKYASSLRWAFRRALMRTFVPDTAQLVRLVCQTRLQLPALRLWLRYRSIATHEGLGFFLANFVVSRFSDLFRIDIDDTFNNGTSFFGSIFLKFQFRRAMQYKF